MISDCFVSPRISRRALNTFLSHFSSGAEELHALEIYSGDGLLVRVAPAPYTAGDKREIYSLSKSFCATAIGFLCDEGKLSVDDYIVNLFPDKLPQTVSEHLSHMQLRHVLSMNTGHGGCVMPKMVGAEDAVRAFLAEEVPYAPGTHFAYNTGATCLLSCIVEKISGMKLVDFLTWKLFLPLDIRNVRWNRTADGHNEGGCGLHVSCDDIAKLGLLYLNRGMWNGKRLLSEAWVQAATSAVSDNSGNGSPDWCAGYGYQFWRNAKEGFRGDGAFGQLCFVLPEKQLVFAVQTELNNMQEEIDALNELAEHLFDGDAVQEPLMLPSYPPIGSAQKLAGFEQTLFVLDTNPMGFTGICFTYDTARDAMQASLSNGVDTAVICAGNGHYEESVIYVRKFKPKLLGLMNTDDPERCWMAASYTAEQDCLTVSIRYRNCPHRAVFTFRKEGDILHVHFDAMGKIEPGAAYLTGYAI